MVVEYTNGTYLSVQVKDFKGEVHTVKPNETLKKECGLFKIKYPHTGWCKL